jgi:hypothetical protein
MASYSEDEEEDKEVVDDDIIDHNKIKGVL